ncbi:Lipoprotein-releasing system transmembrane protein LolE [Anatilimnocola aggregata]|uniref:Lipoprotein-releasing system transmembrane protein LolE n=1 Tax=Anatilimnocola aggregata TaxID=2528021 RepID=A0A517Y9F6_9BACT|nr:FtsX-like permease family protein [Anatilimnocola aggregata]QDU26860.1 Lipoprotein-releasing system transmembrane protein LolE [Anatilimnocola aggregata]
MYKLLLAWRYLRTRYIALASIISVTLGVGTLIVVNSVMAGFAHEMHIRLHSILADICFEAHGMDGFSNPQWHVEEIKKIVGPDLKGITYAVHVPAMVNVPVRGQWVTRQISLVGVDENTYADVSDFREYLLHPGNREKLAFTLREAGYGDEKHPMPPAGWAYRRMKVQYEREMQAEQEALIKSQQVPRAMQPQDAADAKKGATTTTAEAAPPADPFASQQAAAPSDTFDPAKDQFAGVIMGIAIGSSRQRDSEGKVIDYFLCRPGDDVRITFPSAGQPPKAMSDMFTVVDFYESKMSEYDSSFAFIPLRRLQEMRGMIDPSTGVEAVTTIQMRLKPGADLNAVRDKLRARFPAEQFPFRIQTWRDMQGPLLAAVQMETTLLNILLFLIIAVAGFGILATFFMIVVEKTKDIGILKALGAPSRGVMSIFLSYGFSLGLVGSGVGMIGGLLFVIYINNIAKGIEWVTGHEVFDPTIYYFSEIPTIINPSTVVGVMIGATLIAVLASVLPAIRAARLHPVQALRYE